MTVMHKGAPTTVERVKYNQTQQLSHIPQFHPETEARNKGAPRSWDAGRILVLDLRTGYTDAFTLRSHRGGHWLFLTFSGSVLYLSSESTEKAVSLQLWAPQVWQIPPGHAELFALGILPKWGYTGTHAHPLHPALGPASALRACCSAANPGESIHRLDPSDSHQSFRLDQAVGLNPSKDQPQNLQGRTTSCI